MATVLIVDDDPVARMLVEHVVRQRGHDAVVLADGEEALDLLAHRSVDLVLCDHQMPGMDGSSLRRSLGPDFRAPFVLVTGHLRPEEVSEANGLSPGQVAAVVTKPFSSHALVEILTRLLPGDNVDDEGPGRAAR